MNAKYLVWLRNLMLLLIAGELGYFLIQRVYYAHAVEFNSAGITASAGALILLQYAIRRQTEKP